MESAKSRYGPTGHFLVSVWTTLWQFFVGAGVMLSANVIGGFVGGYIISLFWVGPQLPWTPIDKNIGLESAIYGIIAGNLAAVIGLAWFSSRRRDWMPLCGGLALFASELSLLFT